MVAQSSPSHEAQWKEEIEDHPSFKRASALLLPGVGFRTLIQYTVITMMR